MYAVYNTLVAASPTFDIVPELARSWTVSPDGLAITATLQPNVKFHDGTVCDAAAVKWNMDFMFDPSNNSPQGKQISPFLASVDASNPTTVVFRLKKPYAGFMAALVERPGFIVSPTAHQKYGQDYGRHPVGAGMFEFVEWLPDDHVTVKRFDDYWDKGKLVPRQHHLQDRDRPDRPRYDGPDRPRHHVQPDEGRAGAAEEPGVKVATQNPSGHWWATQWRIDRPPFNNKALRQAIAYGVDRDEFVQVMLGGRGSIAAGPTPEVVWWHNPTTRGYTY